LRSPFRTPKRKFVNLALFGVICALIGPGLGYGGLYVSHLVVAFYFIRVCSFSNDSPDSKFSKAELTGLFLGSTIITFNIGWLGATEFTISSLKHLAMVLASFATFMMSVRLCRHFIPIQDSIRLIRTFLFLVLLLCLLEILFDFRLPISRYSRFQPSVEGVDSSISALNIPTAFYGNQNNLALMCVTLLPLVGLFRKSIYNKAMSLAIISVVVVSGSRIALLVVFFLSFLWLIGKPLKYSIGVLISITFFVLSTYFFTFDYLDCEKYISPRICLFADIIREKPELIDLASGSDSIGVRLELSEQAIKLFAARPWFGVGPGVTGDLISVDHFQAGSIVNLHNPPLEILSEYGLIGSIPWVVGWLLMLRVVFYIPHRRFRNILLSASLIAPVASITVSSLYYFTPFWALMGIILGLAGRMSHSAASGKLDSYRGVGLVR
jgi:O-antigen ligase